ncbi:MAG: NAD(P)/FAD-dependent oxidoreductase [Candidatus Methanoperedens sp.]|nr:NAD(P)/FAD-dependent oxidoreductase [Candidatus Methanoperedens sp.]
MKYDVIVVGAGPAGAMAAKYAAINGARTLLIEEHASIGSPVQCTGLVSTKALLECECSEGNFILSKIRGAFVYSPSGEEVCVRGKDIKAYVIDRKIFDRTLVESAVDKGVNVLMRTRFIGMDAGKISVISNGEKKEIEGNVIIGADGIQSVVGRAAALPKCKKFLSGIQFEAPYIPKDPEYVEIFTGNEIAPGFFGWAVPFSGMARIGLAKDPGLPAIKYLEKLLKHPIVASRYRGGRTEHVVGGIPLGPPQKTATDRVLLVGDAAGQVKPTSGGGVYMGAVCAKIAGEVAAKTSRKEGGLSEYEKKWRNAVGKELEIGMLIHKSIGKLTNDNLNEFVSFLNKPDIRELMTEYGDMDHPSVFMQKLILSGNKMQLIKLFGVAFKTLF